MTTFHRTYTVADALLDTLKAHGVTTIFGYPGGAILPFYDALPYHTDIRHILVRNEQGAAFAAQGWARSTKTLGVCVATSGPGATNLVTGIADAHLDSIPILCITGQVPLRMIGKDMFQEVDVTGITLNITKHNYLVEKPSDIVPIVSEAIAIAIGGRPGPVHIDVPKDIMASEHPLKFSMPKIDLSDRDPMLQAYFPVDSRLLKKTIQALSTAKRPILLLGHGIKQAHAEKAADDFIRKTGIPTVTTLLSKGTIPHDNPYYLGMLGMHGFYESNMAMHEADLILNIGSRFDDRIVGRYDIFGKKATVIHVDIDASELNKVVDAQISIHSDAFQFLKQILSSPKLRKLSIKNWWHQIHVWKKTCPYEHETLEFSMKNCLSAFRNIIMKNPSKYILVTDVGQHQMWTSLSTVVGSSCQWLTSGGSGSMGFALPAAMGAAFAHPDKTVLCVTGDGGIQMNIQEIGTVARHNLNLKVLILNNNFLGMVRQWQELFYANNYSAVEMTSPDYAKLADAYGIRGYTIRSQSEMERLHKKLFSDPVSLSDPVIVDYQVVKEDNVFPMVPGGKTLGETIIRANS
ncbi:biosynthetic-type acetolactate synthase large subunit [Candidatus Peregrinibacteria bacterium]|nr:biosynthetic-type acetolactate synthase large subunit [Candidatus Peregrinibacteria bacterium]